MLVGLHYKFLHPPDYDLDWMCRALDLPENIVKLCKLVAGRRAVYLLRLRAIYRPMIKASLADNFNQRVQGNRFFLFDKIFLFPSP